MKEYELKETKDIALEQLLHLYQSVGWDNYTSAPEKLKKGVESSLKVITAWADEQLLGLIRAVGDDFTILYIQDLLVLPEYQNQGIAFTLMKQLLASYPQVRQKVLMTEEAADVRYFYEKCGFYSADKGVGVAFYRFD